jgi:hypothetical protein
MFLSIMTTWQSLLAAWLDNSGYDRVENGLVSMLSLPYPYPYLEKPICQYKKKKR